MLHPLSVLIWLLHSHPRVQPRWGLDGKGLVGKVHLSRLHAHAAYIFTHSRTLSHCHIHMQERTHTLTLTHRPLPPLECYYSSISQLLKVPPLKVHPPTILILFSTLCQLYCREMVKHVFSALHCPKGTRIGIFVTYLTRPLVKHMHATEGGYNLCELSDIRLHLATSLAGWGCVRECWDAGMGRRLGAGGFDQGCLYGPGPPATWFMSCAWVNRAVLLQGSCHVLGWTGLYCYKVCIICVLCSDC